MSYISPFNKMLSSYSTSELYYFFILVLKNLYSKDYYFTLQKKLDDNQSSLKGRLPYNLTRISEDDLGYIGYILPSLDIVNRKEIIVRLKFLDAGFKNCFVAKNAKDEIMYMQWLIDPSENSIIKNKYSRLFSELSSTQVMLENAFTFPKFRGFRLYSQITCDLMNKAREKGFKSCIVYVKSDNIIALNELRNLGFTITKRISERKLLGITKRKLI